MGVGSWEGGIWPRKATNLAIMLRFCFPFPLSVLLTDVTVSSAECIISHTRNRARDVSAAIYSSYTRAVN